MNSRVAIAVGSFLLLSACSGGGAGGATQAAAPSGPRATPSVVPSAQARPASAASRDGCSFISAARASALLGAASGAGNPETRAPVQAQNIGGCDYRSKAGELFYNVNRLIGVSGVDHVEAAKQDWTVRMQGAATVFPTTGGDASVGFMYWNGASTQAWIMIVKGDIEIVVSAIGADKALMQSVALAAASDLLAVV